MSRAHKREIEELLATSKNKTALKMKQALLAHKHMMEMEKFRYAGLYTGLYTELTSSSFTVYKCHSKLN